MLYRFDKKLRMFLFNELEKIGSSGFWSDKVCHLCLEFDAMSHGGTEGTEVTQCHGGVAYRFLITLLG